MDPRSTEKKARLEQALENGIVMIHLDARRPGVVVPERLRDDFQLRLNVSYRFSPPDLNVNEWGVRETLSFSRTPFNVAVPWQAIFAITTGDPSGQAWLFPEDMPPELIEAAAKRWGLTGEEVEQLKREASDTPSMGLQKPPEQEKAPVRGFKPRVVEAEPEAAPPEANSDAPVEEKAPAEQTPNPDAGREPVRRGHLRVIK